MLISVVASAVALAAAPFSRPTTRVAIDTITVGHRALRPQTVRLGVDTMEIYAERDGKRQLINTGISEVSKTADGILVVFIGRSRNGLSIDSVTMSPTTFAPIRHIESFTGKHSAYAFGGGHLAGTSTDSTGTRAVNEPVDAARFDFSMVQHVLNALPLVAGYEATVLTYDVAPLKNHDVGYKVIGEERLTWHGGDVTAWKTVADFGTHQVTRWIDGKTRRDLQWEISMPNMHMIGIAK